MSLSREDVSGIADYVRIALTPAELEEMVSYLNEALAMLEPICRCDLGGVEPTYHPIGDLANVMGADATDAGRALSPEVALENAGSAHGRFFRAPSILGDQGGEP